MKNNQFLIWNYQPNQLPLHHTNKRTEMEISFKKTEISMLHNEDRQIMIFEAENEQGYGVCAFVEYDEHAGKSTGDGIITPIEQDVTYSGFEIVEWEADYTDPETDETRPLTEEEEKAMEREVLDWVKSKLL